MTAVGFIVATKSKNRPVAVALSGLVMGLGIAGMHYTGMAAMRMPADLGYDRFWVTVSILIAIGAAVAALWLAFLNTGFTQRLGAAIVMGFAVSEYAGRRIYYRCPMGRAHEYASFGQTRLALWGSAHHDVPDPVAGLGRGYVRPAIRAAGGARGSRLAR